MEQRALIVDANTGKQLNELYLNSTKGFGAFDVAFSPNGKWFASTYNEETTQLLDLETGKSVLLNEDHGDWVSSVTFSPDGKYLLTGSADGTAIFRDIAANSKLFTFNGQGPIYDVAFSPDGTRVATASQDGTVKLWNTADGTLLYTITSPAGAINNISFSPDGKTLATGSVDGVIRFYYVQLEDVLALAKARITRSLTDAECQTYLHEAKCPETIAKPQERFKPENLLPIQPYVHPVVVVKSGDDSTEITLKIINNSGKMLKLNWMNFKGEEEPFADITPGSFSQGTYATHAWRIRDLADNLLLEYIDTVQPVQTIIINTDMTITVP
jgi:WD40 repeat protein